MKITINRLLALIMVIIMCFTTSACTKINNEEPTTSTEITERPSVNVMINPGITILTIASTLEENGVCSADGFINACQNIPEGYDRLFEGVSAENKLFLLEGYIYPNTYTFYLNDTPENVLNVFLSQMDKKMAEVIDPELYGFGGMSCYDRAKELDMSFDQVIILASVIQSEANLNSDAEGLAEMRKVSSVFKNRLAAKNAGFPHLGSDVTCNYIRQKMSGYIKDNNIDPTDLYAAYCTNEKNSGLHNHDQVSGLPKGPICNPCRAAIIAALWPEDTGYYYFFTDKDYNFHYYTNYKDFNYEWYNLYKH